ncbi:hypothetical protein [Salinirubrum litoreum]|uniref:Syndecan 1 n=1 Tax=Salinirubrum litoreum TaxID=1126234 RepID=A0ABD5REN3_9EURY|nr:hypothetical protein [Salinirubrum litoreum]
MMEDSDDHDSTDSPLGVLGRRRRPPFARLLGGSRPGLRTRRRPRTRARRVDRLARADRAAADAPSGPTRGRATPLSYLRLADLLGFGAGERPRGGDASSETGEPPTAGISPPSTADPTRLSVTRRITVTREVGQSGEHTESGSRRPTGADDPATTLRLPPTGSVGDDRGASPTASGRQSAATGERSRQQTDTVHQQADRRRITTVRPTRPRSPVGLSTRPVRQVPRGRRSVAVLSSGDDLPVSGDSDVGDRVTPADRGPTVPAAGRPGTTATDDTRAGFGTSEPGLSVSAAGAVSTGRAGLTGGRSGIGTTGRAGRSGPLGDGTRASTAGLGTHTGFDEPRLVVASRDSEVDGDTEAGSATGGHPPAERGDSVSPGAGGLRRGTESAETTGSSAVESATTPPDPAAGDADPGSVSLPPATVDRIVDRLSRRLRRDRRIARERGDR